MRNLIILTFLTLFLGCQSASNEENLPPEGLKTAIDELADRFVSDRRTDRLDVEWDPEAKKYTGFTTIEEVYESLQETGEPAFAEVSLLPEDPDNRYALIKVSVANLRSKPGHSQELATQALMGTPIEVLKEEEGWFLVRTPDRYLAWLEPGAFQQVNEDLINRWFAEGLLMYQASSGLAYREPTEEAAIVMEVVAGNLMQQTDRSENGFQQVLFPDGRRAFVLKKDVEPVEMLNDPSTEMSNNQLLTTAASLSGRPYLWGGTSSKGMDCSGFTKMSYYLNGYVIPRDASQQVHAGTDVPLDDNFSQLQPGDLLFFGSYRDDGSERITHVGFYLGDGRFLHAGADNGVAMENSFNEEDEDFAPHRLESLLRARRLSPGDDGVMALAEAFSF